VSLSGAMPRRRWSAAGEGEPSADLVARFGGAATLLVEDLGVLEHGEWIASGGTTPARSVLGARLTVGGQLAGYLLLASVARSAYLAEDEETIALAGLLVAPRVAGLRAMAAAPSRASDPQREPPLVRAAELLAGTAHLADALAGFAAELHRMLPHRGISLHLRRGEDELIALDPAAPRPFGDLPSLDLAEFAGAPVVLGERAWLMVDYHDQVEVVVPLRVAGRIIGVLGVRGSGLGTPRSDAAIALQFADVLAPHLELLRRGAARQRVGSLLSP